MTPSQSALLIFAGLAISTSTTAQTAQIQPGSSLPEGSINGTAAVRQMGDQLATIASDHNFTPAELASYFRGDLSTYITPEGKIFNVCPLAPVEIKNDNNDGTGDGPAVALGGIPLDDFMSLESNPGASKTIYMDVDGHHSVNDGWGHNIQFPAYNTSGSSATFTDGEKSDIIEHWKEVAEDFAPFNVNVTTMDPGSAALIKSNGSDQNYGIRCVMTQATSGFGNGIGGVAFLNVFNDNIDIPCFAFNKGLGAGPMTVSHEVGHTLGLQHDGLNGSSYHPGSSGGAPSWGPIMGAPFGRTLVQWSNGDYPGRTSTQNDVGIITNGTNNIDYHPDDHSGDLLGGGTSLTPGVPASGVIGLASDTDVFVFTIPDAEVTVTVNNVVRGPNVDARFEIWKVSPFSFIGETNPDGTADASGSYVLGAGTYSVLVDGTFQTKTNGPVSDYGSIGGYTIDVSVDLPPEPIVITYPNGLPTELSDSAPTDILINIDPGSETLDTNELFMLYAANFSVPFNRVDLVAQGGDNYIATLPAGACDDEFFYNFTITPTTTGVIYDPADHLDTYSATVVCSTDCVADVNGDGSLTAADFTAWIAAFNANAPECDQNDDGVCTAADFTAWIANFNAGC